MRCVLFSVLMLVMCVGSDDIVLYWYLCLVMLVVLWCVVFILCRYVCGVRLVCVVVY